VPIQPDRSNQNIFTVKLKEDDVKLLYNAVEFYEQNRPLSGDRPPTHQEPTAHLKSMKNILYAMVLESSFYNT
tara:strand:- start:243 stop:461 length:219 start_codon:yes stop_codon:yes gene_type:complete